MTKSNVLTKTWKQWTPKYIEKAKKLTENFYDYIQETNETKRLFESLSKAEQENLRLDSEIILDWATDDFILLEAIVGEYLKLQEHEYNKSLEAFERAFDERQICSSCRDGGCYHCEPQNFM